jgi:hypothetical protein
MRHDVSHTAIDERMLAGLVPARRNRYYYGKMLDVFHLSMEQRYMLGKQWLFNRAVVGPGVVYGLGVEAVSTRDGNGLVIRSGLAFDGWGREIVVPEDIMLVPLRLTDQCGAPVNPPDRLPERLTVQICYHECPTDYAPAMVSEPGCGCDDDCEAGTIVEAYCLKVLAGTAPDVTEPCLDVVRRGLDAGDLHGVLCELSKAAPPEVDDPCLTLANVSVAADGTLAVDDCGPRVIAPTNRILMQLIRCLIECCHEDPPPPATLLTVTGVRLLSTRPIDPALPDMSPDDPNLEQRVVLEPPNPVIRLQPDPIANVLEIQFDPAVPYNAASVVLGQSLVVGPLPGVVDQLFTMPHAIRVYRPSPTGFNRGHTKVGLTGGPDVAGPAAPPAVTSAAGTRLDGEFPTAGGPGWHSGDGTEGGIFVFDIVGP